jgi:ATP-dependent RNA helicase DDX41
MDPSGRGLKRSHEADVKGEADAGGNVDDTIAYVPLRVRRQKEQERIEDAARQTAAAQARRVRAEAEAAVRTAQRTAEQAANPDANKTLLQIQQEMLRERGGVEETEEERLREQERYLLEHLSKERAPLLGRKQVAGVGEVFTRAMETGWRPPRHLRVQSASAHAATRAKYNITVDGAGADSDDASGNGGVPPPITKFAHMRFPPSILAALKAKGISAPTPIQIQGLPVVLSGRDMIGIAFTGSGKTLVFTLPMVIFALQAEAARPLARSEGPVGLVLVPSRELAGQIAEVAEHFASFVNAATGACPPPPGAVEAGLVLPPPLTQQQQQQQQYGGPLELPSSSSPSAAAGGLRYPAVGRINVLLAIGGINMAEQWQRLPQGCGVHVVVASPGRLVDLLEKGRLRLDRCVYLAMDEADRLVDLGFEETMRGVFDAFPAQRQTVLFSATMPKKIQEFALTALVDPVVVNVGRAGRANLDVIQEVEYVKADARSLYLLECLQKTPPPVIVFAANQSSVDHIHEYLLLKGVDAVAVHGGKDQEERSQAIKLFKAGQKDVLVATDVASKGLDFPDIQHVINYDMPQEIEDYIHRIGRTGRCGKTGVATSFVNRDCGEVFLLDLKHLLKEARQKIPPVLMSLEDPADFVGADGDETRVCEYCDGRGHRVIECPKLRKKSTAMKNTYGYDMVEDQS